MRSICRLSKRRAEAQWLRVLIGWAVFRKQSCGMAAVLLIWRRAGAAVCRLGQAWFQPQELRIQCCVDDP
eukprot:11204465-Lingulodinium_polyedra.AAC.1